MGADEDSEGTEACFGAGAGLDDVFKFGGEGRVIAGGEAFGQQSLGGIAAEAVAVSEHVCELFVGGFAEIEDAGTWSVFVADAVEASAEAVDTGGIAVGVLVAVIAIVPIEDAEAAIGAGFLDDGHEPCVIGCEEVFAG